MRAVDSRFDKHYLKAFLAGNDVLLFPTSLKKGVDELKGGLSRGEFSKAELDQRVRKILAWKYALEANRKKIVLNGDYNRPAYEAAIYRALKSGMVLVKNNNVIPLSDNVGVKTRLILIGNTFSSFAETIQKYRPVDVVHVANAAQYKETLNENFNGQVVVAVAGNVYSRSTNYGLSNAVQNILRQLPAKADIALILFSNPYALAGLDSEVEQKLKSILIAYEPDKNSQHIAAQIVMGGAPAVGILPVSGGGKYPSGTGLYTQKIRLGYSVPEMQGLWTDSLKRIDRLIELAIKIKAMPGCQVLIARDGEIVYDKSFGHHTYDKATMVKWSDVYDIASLTKVVSTTPLMMHLTESEWVSPDAKLGSFNGIVSSPFKQDITVSELLMHQSGLKPYIPFHFMMLDADALPEGLFSKRRSPVFSIYLGDKFYINNKARFKKGFVSQALTPTYTIEGAHSFWVAQTMRDSLRIWIDSSLVDTRRSYRYSDLNFYYLQQVAETVTGKSLDKLADSLLYKPLGMYRTGYLPLTRLGKSEIVPTENDRYFRRQLVHGYVHDQTAALQGGVGGNAGVFSNSTDLAKYCQMLLDKGFYGGKRFFEPQTIDLFTQTGNQLNRRGLGFDKPEPDTKKTSPACKSASLQSFGHTGFTGTYLWVDPQRNLIYIFLSNRVNPDVYNTKLSEKNIRTNIHQMVYNAFMP
jgi:beta-N-acetylhexosaminidase